jgi:hypothetical protein
MVKIFKYQTPNISSKPTHSGNSPFSENTLDSFLFGNKLLATIQIWKHMEWNMSRKFLNWRKWSLIYKEVTGELGIQVDFNLTSRNDKK